MLRYLDLSAEQWKKVRALAAERLDKMNDLMAKMGKLRLELWGQSSQAKPDAVKVKKLFAQMAEIHADLNLSGRDYLQKIKGLLTKEQLKRLKDWRH
jgi:Spy/CpxP family protein refolding chaperone